MEKTYLIHNRDGHLIEFMEFHNDKIKVHVWIKRNTLYQIFLQEDEEGEFYRKARIQYDQDIKGLEYLRLYGEPRVVVQNDDKLEKKSEFRTEDGFPYLYSVKNDFLKRVLHK